MFISSVFTAGEGERGWLFAVSQACLANVGDWLARWLAVYKLLHYPPVHKRGKVAALLGKLAVFTSGPLRIYFIFHVRRVKASQL